MERFRYQTVPSPDLDEEDPCQEQPASRSCRIGWVSFIFTALALCGLGKMGWQSKRLPGIAGVTDVAEEFSMFSLSMATYEKLFGDTDPFQFKCPVPGILAEGHDNASCCGGYNTLGWPFQFKECSNLGYCTTCFVETSKAEMQQHQAIEFAGAAWAATVSVMNKAQARSAWLEETLAVGSSHTNRIDDAHIGARRMNVRIGHGLLRGDTNVCPAVSDWDVDMLNEDKENIHARVFKSPSAKMAIVAFRGTQFKSIKNWHVDADIQRIPMVLPNGQITYVHEGFLTALEHVLPHVKRWVDGYIFGLFNAVPKDWKLIFTGHSLGGALAMLAATKAYAEKWPRTPEATIVFGVPRMSDKALDDWWQSQDLCHRLIRVNTYNDMIHVMPFHKMWSAYNTATNAYDCFTQPLDCIRQSKVSRVVHSPIDPSPDPSKLVISNQWAHVCPKSEIFVPSGVKGINQQLEEMSLFGGVLAHLNENCLYGYIYAVLHSNITTLDKYCNLSTSICSGLTHLGPE
ncbi:unnamed protein product [Effrenium voratum]|uniref:Fungal lipase-type domain-containing protein n=1 Tax=Effrenium voratum TaxID=2562239 RepID=A0AA36I186_9DINO|nr:unnamed protein product [Effrenium voratum]CAJ1459051.1 unnamed protein product [Effrenium voratum]